MGPTETAAVGERSVVLTNPGGARWLRAAAVGLQRAGLLRRYLTPVVYGGRSAQVVGRLPTRIQRPLVYQLARRSKPEGLADQEADSVALASELAFAAVSRLPLSGSAWVSVRDWSRRRFDHLASARIGAGDRAVVSTVTAAQATFARAAALGAACVLDYPIAHYEFAQRVLGEEARRYPELAGTLQLSALTPRTRARVDAEIKAADRILVGSEIARRSFLEAGIAEAKLSRAPYGVDTELFRPVRGPRLPDGISLRAITAGQISQRKGLTYLLEGFVSAAIADSELLFVGSLGSRSAAALLAETHGARHINHVPNWTLPAHYASADVFVLPSLVEGLPQTALEAMACGLPLIVSENTLGPDVIADGEEGFVVPIRDPDAIAERLRFLFENPDQRRRMGDAARRRAEQLTWTAYGERVAAAVGELV